MEVYLAYAGAAGIAGIAYNYFYNTDSKTSINEGIKNFDRSVLRPAKIIEKELDQVEELKQFDRRSLRHVEPNNDKKKFKEVNPLQVALVESLAKRFKNVRN